MKTANAIKRLEKKGFEVHHNDNSQWWADKDGQRISWIDQRGEVHALYLQDIRFKDDSHSGCFMDSLKMAISIAENSAKRLREEAPMIVRKQREAEARRAAKAA